MDVATGGGIADGASGIPYGYSDVDDGGVGRHQPIRFATTTDFVVISLRFCAISVSNSLPYGHAVSSHFKADR